MLQFVNNDDDDDDDDEGFLCTDEKTEPQRFLSATKYTKQKNWDIKLGYLIPSNWYYVFFSHVQSDQNGKGERRKWFFKI